MREVEKEVNAQARAAGIESPEVNLVFTMDKQTDVRRYNVPIANEVSALKKFLVLKLPHQLSDNDNYLMTKIFHVMQQQDYHNDILHIKADECNGVTLKNSITAFIFIKRSIIESRKEEMFERVKEKRAKKLAEQAAAHK
uniref:Uncharacterized protein n=1 Tax=Acrobeloides nanus TaxID=290746 RepID=A0A914C4Z2_9BILA